VQRLPSGFGSALLGTQSGLRKALHLQTVLAGAGPLAPLGQDQVVSDMQFYGQELVSGMLKWKELWGCGGRNELKV
jgi:hypothetical protein